MRRRFSNRHVLALLAATAAALCVRPDARAQVSTTRAAAPTSAPVDAGRLAAALREAAGGMTVRESLAAAAEIAAELPSGRGSRSGLSGEDGWTLARAMGSVIGDILRNDSSEWAEVRAAKILWAAVKLEPDSTPVIDALAGLLADGDARTRRWTTRQLGLYVSSRDAADHPLYQFLGYRTLHVPEPLSTAFWEACYAELPEETLEAVESERQPLRSSADASGRFSNPELLGERTIEPRSALVGVQAIRWERERSGYIGRALLLDVWSRFATDADWHRRAFAASVLRSERALADLAAPRDLQALEADAHPVVKAMLARPQR